MEKLKRVETSEMPLKRPTTGERVAAALRASIQRGTPPPGARLLQTELGIRFGVSSTPIREALALLQAEGLVKMDPHHGAIVHQPTQEELNENYRILSVLETMAVAAAIPLISDEDTSRLQSVIDSMRKAETDHEWIELNDFFHLTLYRISGMERLCSIIENIRDSCSVYFYIYVSSRDQGERSDDEHQAILDACNAGDVRRAKVLVQSHINDARKELTHLLRQKDLVVVPETERRME